MPVESGAVAVAAGAPGPGCEVVLTPNFHLVTLRPGAENFETVPAGRLRVELYAGKELLAVHELVGRAGRVETVAFEE